MSLRSLLQSSVYLIPPVLTDNGMVNVDAAYSTTGLSAIPAAIYPMKPYERAVHGLLESEMGYKVIVEPTRTVTKDYRIQYTDEGAVVHVLKIMGEPVRPGNFPSTHACAHLVIYAKEQR